MALSDKQRQDYAEMSGVADKEAYKKSGQYMSPSMVKQVGATIYRLERVAKTLNAGANMRLEAPREFVKMASDATKITNLNVPDLTKLHEIVTFATELILMHVESFSDDSALHTKDDPGLQKREKKQASVAELADELAKRLHRAIWYVEAAERAERSAARGPMQKFLFGKPESAPAELVEGSDDLLKRLFAAAGFDDRPIAQLDYVPNLGWKTPEAPVTLGDGSTFRPLPLVTDEWVPRGKLDEMRAAAQKKRDEQAKQARDEARVDASPGDFGGDRG